MDKVLGMIGLAQRARKIVSGENLCVGAIKNGSSRLVIIANDASQNTKKSVINSCEYHKVKYVFFGETSDLGRIFSSDSRAVISINDKNFANAILNKIDELAN